MSRKSANILVLGWLLVLLGAIGLILTYSIETKGSGNLVAYRSGDCPLTDTYYKNSDLTNSEKKQFSSNAKAFDLIGQSKQKYRLVADYKIDTQTRKKIQVRVFIGSSEHLASLAIKHLLNGTANDETKIGEDEKRYAYLSSDFDIDSNTNYLGLTINKQNKCEFSLNELIQINTRQDYGNPVRNWVNGNSVLTNFKGDEIILNSGDNYLTFEDWSYIGYFFKKGLSIFSFSPKQNKWLQVESNEPIAQPAKVYLVKNNSTKRLTIDFPKPFRIPDDLSPISLQKGWNLIAFNDPSQKLSEVELAINQDLPNLIPQSRFKLHKLVDDGYVAGLSRLEKSSDSPQDLSELLESQALGRFWINLVKKPDNTAKIPNLVLSVEGVGDSFAGRQVPLKIIIENQDSYLHQVISSSESDPCQVGVRVRNTSGKVIYDDYQGRICPLWPKLEDLPIGAKKEYNYLWEAPAKLKGSYIMEIYFNYSRLLGNQLIKTSSINLQ